MPTDTRRKKAIKNLGTYRHEKQALMDAGYSESYARSGQIKKTKPFRDLMEKAMPSSLLLKKHVALLNKTEKLIVSDGQKDGSHIEDTGQPHSDVVRALDIAYKLRGEYPKEAAGEGGTKVLIINVTGAIAKKYGIKQNEVIIQEPK